MGEEIAFENGRVSDFQGLMTFTLDQVRLYYVCILYLCFSPAYCYNIHSFVDVVKRLSEDCAHWLALVNGAWRASDAACRPRRALWHTVWGRRTLLPVVKAAPDRHVPELTTRRTTQATWRAWLSARWDADQLRRLLEITLSAPARR